MFYVEGIFAWRKGILGWEDRGKGRMDSVFTNDIRAGERTQAAGGLQEGLSLISRTYIKKKPGLWYVLGILALETGMGGKQTPRFTVTNVAY